ncbi:MAG: ATP-binding cassette domain-containing protein [Candidatus Heimdallarchaeota archaeon]|nr:ATP-binding cassette domain-containing protein [Candidatus Heimdallarchaeota archaeon]
MFLASPLYHLLNKRPPDFPTTKTGVIIAVFGVLSEWVLMFLVIIIGGRPYFPDIPTLIITLLGSAILIIGGVVWQRIDKNEPLDKKMRAFRKYIQLIFQDPYSSLNPRMTVYDIISEGLDLYGLAYNQKEKEQKVLELMDLVGLAPFHIYRYPHEFSGGQRQRIGIARALSVNPQIIVADEPVSALDVSIRAQILNLLDDLQNTLGLTYIVVAHDLSVIRHVSDRVAVMYVGKMMEIADTDELFLRPLHPYTEALMSAVPIPDPKTRKERIILRGDVPTPINPQPGCRFKDRCNYAKDKCNQEPTLDEVFPGHQVACWFSKEIYSSRGEAS